MNHLLLLSEFLNTPWAIDPERLDVLAQVFVRWALDQPASPVVMEAVAADVSATAARRDQAQSAGGSIAVLPLYGATVQRTNLQSASGGGVASLQNFTRAFRAAVSDPSVSGILLDIDSPGGSVFGVQELANEIYQARSQKPIVAIANSTAASAAYWIGSSAGEFYVTPGGEAGSVGVYAAHRNMAKALEQQGVDTTLVSAGRYKTEGNPFGPLSDEARAHMQARIDAHYGAFTRAIARNRGTDVAAVRGGMGEGRTLNANDARAAGLVDDIATFDQVLARMSKGASRKPSRTVAMHREIDILDA